MGGKDPFTADFCRWVANRTHNGRNSCYFSVKVFKGRKSQYGTGYVGRCQNMSVPELLSILPPRLFCFYFILVFQVR